MTEQDRRDRAEVERIWRETMQAGPQTELAATPLEWALMLALYRANKK